MNLDRTISLVWLALVLANIRWLMSSGCQGADPGLPIVCLGMLLGAAFAQMWRIGK